MKKTGILAALFTLLFCTVAMGQGPVLQNIVGKLKTYANSHITEQAYLSFDKPYYAVGDTMYFKAFMVIGERHEVSQASGILHVDLVDPSNHIVNARILKLEGGMAKGDFTLVDTLKSGLYRIRAYTRYMQNTPDYFFDKPVLINGNGSNTANIDTHQASDPDIQFFPEGGPLITALMSKVAFKAIGTNGLAIKVKGSVVDNTNAQVAEFTSNDLGMGSFFIQPEDGKTYKAKVTFANGKQTTVNLPAVMPKGIALRAKDTLGKVSIDIVCNKAYLAENNNKDINLLIYSGGAVRQVTTKLDSRQMGMDVAESQFPSGVLRITLFSQDGEPLSERLVFLQGADLLNIALSSDKASYKTREKVTVNVAAKTNGAPAAGSFSAAVIDETRVPFSDNDETTILSYLLLTSEVKGYVEKPNYYFAQNTSQRRADLDLLMMTQGYRKFTWKQLSDTTHFTFAPEKSLFISGVQKNAAGQPMANKDVMLISKGSQPLGQKTNQSGQFTFDGMEYEDNAQFTLQATGSTKDKNSSNFTLIKPTEPAAADQQFMSGYAAQLQAYAGKTAGGAGIGPQGNFAADQELTAADISGSTSLTSALKNHLNGVSFTGNAPYLKGYKYPMLVVVDGKIRASDVNLDNISAANVADVKVLKGKNAESFGTNGSSGVLVINTRYGSSESGQAEYTSAQIKNSSAPSVAKRVDDVHYRSSSIAGPGHADQVLHADAFEHATSMTTALNGLLHGVDFVNGLPYLRGGSTVSFSGASNVSMYIIVDGVAIGHGSVDNINPHAVETVEVLKGPNASIYGAEGSPGVMVITTKTTSDPVNSPQSSLGSLQFRAHGLYKAREFYSPKYSAASQSNGPDLRSTIYWNPSLTTDSGGNGSFEFYNADGHGSYRVMVEGMDTKGNIGWTVYRYKVE